MVWASEVWVVKFKCQDTPMACLNVLEDVFKCSCVIPVFIRPCTHDVFPIAQFSSIPHFYISTGTKSQHAPQPMILKLCAINEKRTRKY